MDCEHYDTDAEFFLLFLDARHRAYSQAVYLQDEEALEDAQTRKLDFTLEAVKARPETIYLILEVAGVRL